MAKKRVFLLVTLVMMMAFTVSAYAINYSGSGKKRGVTYNISKTGINSSFNAVGTTQLSSTKITNNKSYKIYVVATVQRIDQINETSNASSEEKAIDIGVQLSSGNLTRPYNSKQYDFYHYAESYASATKASATRQDTYAYTAKQYYD